MLVVDAPALVHLVVPSGHAAYLQRAIDDPEETLHAPHLIDVEVTHALRGLAQRGAITERAAALALGTALGVDLQRYAHTDLLPRVWELRHNTTVYDAIYLALAEVLRAPLVTRDAGLRDVPGCRARIEVV